MHLTMHKLKGTRALSVLNVLVLAQHEPLPTFHRGRAPQNLNSMFTE